MVFYFFSTCDMFIVLNFMEKKRMTEVVKLCFRGKFVYDVSVLVIIILNLYTPLCGEMLFQIIVSFKAYTLYLSMLI